MQKNFNHIHNCQYIKLVVKLCEFFSIIKGIHIFHRFKNYNKINIIKIQ